VELGNPVRIIPKLFQGSLDGNGEDYVYTPMKKEDFVKIRKFWRDHSHPYGIETDSPSAMDELLQYCAKIDKLKEKNETLEKRIEEIKPAASPFSDASVRQIIDQTFANFSAKIDRKFDEKFLEMKNQIAQEFIPAFVKAMSDHMNGQPPTPPSGGKDLYT
jgi:hypothetical protein